MLAKIFLLFMSIILTQYNANANDIKWFGFIKASGIHANRAMNSYNNVNLSAVTSTASESAPDYKKNRTSFQVAQSRFGVEINKDNNMGIIEMDFIDFDKSSPTTKTVPRLRRAFIKHPISNNGRLELGQDWDIFSPVRPQTFDIIGLYFNGGNTGFMRQQFKYVHENNDISMAYALGAPTQNASPKDNNLETNNEVSHAANIIKRINDFELSASGIISKRLIQDKNKNIWGTSLGINSPNIKFETYYGEGLSFLNVLTSDQTSNGKQYGAYLTYELALLGKLKTVIGSGYSVSKEAGTPTFDVATNRFTQLGLTQNQISRIALYHIDGPTQLFTEFSYLATKYTKFSYGTTIEVGAIFNF